MTGEPIRLRRIETVSPTLAELLRQCKLRAGLSRAEGSSRYVLGNPKAWLGTAYHAVLEAAGGANPIEIEGIVAKTWDSAVQAEYQRARSHPLDKRYGPPESWPGYHLVRAMALVRARELVASDPGKNGSTATGESPSPAWREREFSGAEGRIIGRPDVVRPGEVIDFKTGAVLEDEDLEEVRPAYMRQLRLYAFLVKETLGWWPQRAVLMPMTGPPVAIEIDPAECEAEAVEAIRLLEEYNTALNRGADVVDLASPSPEACRWCPFQLLCPAFWSALGPDWKQEFCSGAVAGTAMERPRAIHGGAALSLSITAVQGTEPPSERISLSPLDPSIHSDLLRVQAGDRVRVTGLYRRADDRVAPTIRTQIALERALPGIERSH